MRSACLNSGCEIRGRWAAVAFWAAIAMVLSVTAPAEAERPESTWVSEDADGNLEYRTTDTGDRIPDFSHCGYRGGGVRLPEVPAVVEIEPEPGDNAGRLQEAIDELAAQPRGEDGYRGALLLKAGEWKIDSPVMVRDSGIVIRGEGQGSDGTILRVRGFEEMWSAVFSVGEDVSWSEVNGTRQPVEADHVPLGETGLKVAAPDEFSVGDRVIVEVQRNERWVSEIGMDRIPPRHDERRIMQWPPDGYILRYDRTVAEVGDDRVTLDAPIGEAIRSEHGGADLFRYEFPDRIEQFGMENLTAVAQYRGEPEDQREEHAWVFIHTLAVENAWIRDITTRHFVFGTLRSSPTTKAMTVQDSRCIDPVSEIRGNRRYGFYIGGQLMLVQRCYANEDRHAFAFNARTPGPNAFVDCLAEGSHADSGPHHRWSTAGLMDNVRVPDHSIRVQNRLHFGSGHGWAGANFTIWNSEAGHFMIHNPPIAKNWAIGLVGERRTPTFAEPETYERFTHPDHIEEHGLDQPPEWGFDELGYSGWESRGEPVRPVSLYLRQLEERLGSEAVDNISDRPYSFSKAPE